MNNQSVNRQINESFKGIKKELIFGQEIEEEPKLWHKFKEWISFCVLLAMSGIVILFVFLLFQFKRYLIIQQSNLDFYISIIIALVNAIQITIFSYIYTFVATKLNDWENHKYLDIKYQSLSIKLILFDFINNFTSMYYIAFYKPYHEGCKS